MSNPRYVDNDRLWDTEWALIHAIGGGCTLEECGEMFCYEPNTVRVMLWRIYKKLDLPTRRRPDEAYALRVWYDEEFGE